MPWAFVASVQTPEGSTWEKRRRILFYLVSTVAKTYCAGAQRGPGQEKEGTDLRATGEDESNGGRAARAAQPMSGGAVSRDAKPPRAGRQDGIFVKPNKKIAGFS